MNSDFLHLRGSNRARFRGGLGWMDRGCLVSVGL